MDLGDKDEFGLEKRRGDHLSYHPAATIPADWQLGNPPLGLVPADTLVGHRDHQTGSSQCPPVSMASESFLPNIWSHPSTSHNLGDFSETNAHTNASNVTIRKPAAGPLRLDVGWNPPPDLLSKGVFLQNSSGVLPPSLAHFAADTAFIDRAARFSCFNAGNFSAMVNPFGGASESSSPHSTALRDLPGAQIQKSELNADVSMAMDHSSNIGSPMKNQREKGSLHGVGISNDESGERDLSGCAQVEAANLGSAAGDSSSKGFNSKKRKKTNQDMELDQAQEAPTSPAENTKEIVDTKQKGEQSSSAMATGKPASKNAKDGSEASKEDYIHVRARRGQATNSHSLAERVRREKISERMKFLQDLVPGCSKVTGKAVMLDEIINYVQSLQRQVEFLSMKLATVNPRLDFNIEGLLSKDLLQSRGGPSSTIGFSPDIIHPQIHLPHKGLVQAGIPGILNPSDALRRTINAQLTAMSGYKEPATQMPNAWDDELHNVVQMTYGANPPLSEQDLNGEPRDAFPL